MCRRAKESTRSFSRAGGVRCLLRDSAFCAGKSVSAIGMRNPTECVYPFKRNGRETERRETKTKERRFTNRLFFGGAHAPSSRACGSDDALVIANFFRASFIQESY